MSRDWFAERTVGAPYFCVVGSPVEHSLSPRIHTAFGQQTGRQLVYDRIEVAAGELADAVADFRALGGVGMNVTVPLKREAWELADVRSDRAQLAGAANTLVMTEAAGVHADNTDGVGLVRDLQANLGVELAGREVLVLGAGGAVAGVLPALLDAGARLRLSNRTAARARALRDALSAEIELVAWGGVGDGPADIVINGTALSLDGEVPPLAPAAVAPRTLYYDMMYSEKPTAFVAWARAAGAERAVDGLGMLVEQAAEAFLIWHGVRPQTAPVLAELRPA